MCYVCCPSLLKSFFAELPTLPTATASCMCTVCCQQALKLTRFWRSNSLFGYQFRQGMWRTFQSILGSFIHTESKIGSRRWLPLCKSSNLSPRNMLQGFLTGFLGSTFPPGPQVLMRMREAGKAVKGGYCACLAGVLLHCCFLHAVKVT